MSRHIFSIFGRQLKKGVHVLTDDVMKLTEKNNIKFDSIKVPLDSEQYKQVRKYSSFLTSSSWIAGSSVMHSVSYEFYKCNDVDVYHNSIEDFEINVQTLTNRGWKIKDVIGVDEDNVIVDSLFDREYTKNIHNVEFRHNDFSENIQLIKSRFFYDIEHVLSTFDFRCCMIGYEKGILSNKLHHEVHTVSDIKNKVLYPNRILSLNKIKKRLEKYIHEKGFTWYEGNEILNQFYEKSKIEDIKIQYDDVKKEKSIIEKTNTVWDDPNYRFQYWYGEPKL